MNDLKLEYKAESGEDIELLLAGCRESFPYAYAYILWLETKYYELREIYSEREDIHNS